MKKFLIIFLIFSIFLNCKSTNTVINENKNIYKTDASSDASDDNGFEKIVFPKKNPKEIEEELKKLQIRQVGKYTIKIGDIYNIYVDADDRYSTLNAIVKLDGYISIKRVGEVFVEGSNLEEVKTIIENKLKEYINVAPKVSIIPVKIKDAQVNILGEINKPGSYAIEGNTRLLDVICAAGGISVLQLQNEKVEIADLDSAYIMRDNKVLPVNFFELIAKGNSLHNIIVQDKDYIYIPSLSSLQVFILGEVNNPGKFMLSKQLTVSKLIAEAGGIKNSSSNQIFVVRNLKNPVLFKVNINKILTKGSVDFVLKSDDVVYVPKNAITIYNEVINDIMPTINLLSSTTTTFLNIDDMRKRIKHYPDDYPKDN
jgi:polysaccharide biosynthesis/export protein